MSQQRNNPQNKQNNVKGPRTTNSRQVRTDIGKTPQNVAKRDIHKNTSSQGVKSQKPKSQATKTKKKKKSKKKRFKRTCLGFILTMIIVIATIGGIGAGIFVRIIQDSPNLQLISVEPNVYTSIVYDKDGKEIDRFHGKENREYVTLDEISTNLQNAIVSVEDERFYDHFGIDIKGILRAVYTTIKNKIIGSSGLQGASTITQQLIKNNVTKVTRNTIETKIQEQYLAVSYEKYLENKFGSKMQAKKYILELYLNTIALGHGYNGVQAAALGYFNKDAKDLTLAESACIAAITNNPSLYSPRTQPENNKKRVTKILNHMLEQGMITKAQYDEALLEDIYSKVSDGNAHKKVEGNIIHGYFEDSLFEQVSKDLQEKHNISKGQADNLIYNGGLQIHSTKDSNMQNILEASFNNNELFPNVVYKYDVTYTVSIEDTTTGKQEHKDYRQFVKTKEEGDAFVANKKAEIESGLSQNQRIVADRANFSTQPQASMVIMDYRTGNVTALMGGRGEKTVNRGFNRATDSKRQPGSVFKVLAAYAPAIDTGVLMPGSVIVDEPIKIGKYSPKNWYGESYRGPSTVREGIEQSMNILAVKAMDMVGVDAAYQYLLNFGFTTLENDNHLSTALGGITYGVTQMEVTAAYATIANGGKYYEPKLYTKVLDHDGNVILDATTREPKQVIKETTAYMLTDMMKGVVTKGTGTAAKFKNISMPIAGKTGTTQETKDLTFVGYTPYYVAGVWFGYDRYDNTVPNMIARVGGKRVIPNDRYHLVLWRDVMEKIHKDLPKANFGPRPKDIVDVSICLDSGLLATEDCKNDPRGNRVIVDMFIKGTEPKKICDKHQVIAICKDSGKLAGDFCPKESIIFKSVFDFNEENKAPTDVCDIHLEKDITIDPNESTESTSSETNQETPSITINPNDATSQNQNTNNTTQSTTMPQEVGNIVPSVPQEQSTEATTTHHITQQPTTQQQTTGAPVFNTP
ncbi:transglycosylase domain-containing protein [[Clostridium] colinum]|uniref:transglycosylase domain-containing protein n=1 Tax=[Clostridium] colinum TaxID=36835 RepID=UPI002025285B|nr:PBP1A family penicillin-binding protein [[Clostridium] colinum]